MGEVKGRRGVWFKGQRLISPDMVLGVHWGLESALANVLWDRNTLGGGVCWDVQVCRGGGAHECLEAAAAVRAHSLHCHVGGGRGQPT